MGTGVYLSALLIGRCRGEIEKAKRETTNPEDAFEYYDAHPATWGMRSTMLTTREAPTGTRIRVYDTRSGLTTEKRKQDISKSPNVIGHP